MNLSYCFWVISWLMLSPLMTAVMRNRALPFSSLNLALFVTDRLHLDVINLNFSSVLAFAEPSFAFIYLVKAVAIDMGYTAVFWLDYGLIVINKWL